MIDVGTNRTDDGLVGDVDFEAVSEVAGAITPGPGRRRPDDDRDVACKHRCAAGVARRPAEGYRLRRGNPLPCIRRDMDADRLGTGEQIAGVRVALLFILMFLSLVRRSRHRRSTASSERSARGLGVERGLQRLGVVRLHRPGPAVTIVVAVGGRRRDADGRATSRFRLRPARSPLGSASSLRCSILYRFIDPGVESTRPRVGASSSASCRGRDRLRRLAVDAGGGHLLRRPRPTVRRPDRRRHGRAAPAPAVAGRREGPPPSSRGPGG